MLFLLNEKVLDIGDPAETLEALGMVDPNIRAGLGRVVKLGQEAAFASASFVSSHPDLARTVAALVAIASEANCALFICPPRAQSAREVGVRFANAPLTTMAYLWEQQNAGRLSVGHINAAVWMLAGAAPSA